MNAEQQWMLQHKDGSVIEPGQHMVSFRDESWRFDRISRTPEPGKSGKVQVTSKSGALREFYPQVFGCKIVQASKWPRPGEAK